MTEAARAQEINDLIEESVYGARGAETAPCANAWEVSKLIASLQARVEALEAGQKNKAPGSIRGELMTNLPVTPPPEMVERNPECVASWPDCYEGGYDPRCCRFPKSCSCEVRQEVPEPATTPTPASSLVERVAAAIDGAPYDDGLHQWDEARAAIREMAAAARYRDLNGQNVTVMTWEMVAQWLEQEAEQ